jgi:hypothetical protein
MVKFKDTKVFKMLAERWKGRDMETYFIEKNKTYHERLKKEVKNLT